MTFSFLIQLTSAVSLLCLQTMDLRFYKDPNPTETFRDILSSNHLNLVRYEEE